MFSRSRKTTQTEASRYDASRSTERDSYEETKFLYREYQKGHGISRQLIHTFQLPLLQQKQRAQLSKQIAEIEGY